MFMDQPECAIIFSWHIADELAPKLRAKGYKGMLVTRARCRGSGSRGSPVPNRPAFAGQTTE